MQHPYFGPKKTLKWDGRKITPIAFALTILRLRFLSGGYYWKQDCIIKKPQMLHADRFQFEEKKKFARSMKHCRRENPEGNH